VSGDFGFWNIFQLFLKKNLNQKSDTIGYYLLPRNIQLTAILFSVKIFLAYRLKSTCPDLQVGFQFRTANPANKKRFAPHVFRSNPQ